MGTLKLIGVEKNGLEFFTFFKLRQKSKHFFSMKNRGFCGVKPGPLGASTIHIAIHRIKIEGYYLENLNFQSRYEIKQSCNFGTR